MAEDFKISLRISGTNINHIGLGNSQHQGMRPYQEDSFGFSSIEQSEINRHGFVAIVSDGMGGMSCGDKVSRYAVECTKQIFADYNSDPIHIRFIRAINRISTASTQNYVGGGATLSAVYCTLQGIYWCSTGDSRVYLYRNDRLYQLTRDFDYAERLLDRVIDGEITFDEADSDPKKDSLAEYIGSGEELHPDVNIKPFIPEFGDKLLICSDGVYNALTEDELLLQLEKQPQRCADGILAAVLNKGYENQDNFTSVILEFT